MNKVRKFGLLCMSVFALCLVLGIPAEAGEKTFASDLLTASGELNNTDWNSTDTNIAVQNGKVVIPAKTSTENTKFISKNVAVAHEALENVITVDGSFSITNLPKNQKLVFALGLGSIEAALEEVGNVEIAFVNNGGIYATVTAYTADGAETVLGKTRCNIAPNSEFGLTASITGEQLLTVKINGTTLCQKKINVAGSGRFGIMQTGSCGATVSQCHIEACKYDTPQNMDIAEDFEDGEWNAKLLNAQLFGNNKLGTGVMQIEDYNGSRVLMVRNAGTTSANGTSSYLTTMYKYSNFEISFDVPYFLRNKIFNEEGVQTGKPCTGLYIAFGVEQTRYNTVLDTTKYNSDAIVIGANEVTSLLVNKDLKVDLAPFNLYKEGSNEGFSVKFSLIDGQGTLQMKSLTGSEWKTIFTQDYNKVFREGYVALWTVASGDYALDNLKIINKDVSPNLTTVDYTSSVITAEDYDISQEDTTLVFRDGKDGAEDKKTSIFADGNVTLAVIITVVSVFLVGGVIVVLILAKKKKQKRGGSGDEEK